MTPVIRDMQPADLDQVMALLKHWNLAPIVPTAEIPQPERTEFFIENALVAMDGDRVVGVISYIRLSDTLAEGASFAVAPEFRSLGIGKRLIDEGRRKMYRLGTRRVRSEADRPEVIRLLIARGHRIVGTTPKRHAFGSPDADHWTVLELDLDTLPELADLRSKHGGIP
jgi:GNAT superfamily N-acetyltransferase